MSISYFVIVVKNIFGSNKCPQVQTSHLVKFLKFDPSCPNSHSRQSDLNTPLQWGNFSWGQNNTVLHELCSKINDPKNKVLFKRFR